MVESSNSMSKSSETPVYVVVGDAGVGKSTFINCLLERNVAFAPYENPSGESVTKGA